MSVRALVAMAVLGAVPLAPWSAPPRPFAGSPTDRARLGGSAWHFSRSPKLRVDVAAGCPRTVTARDVVNTFPGPPLVPAGPAAGLVCRYYGLPHLGQLGRQTRLGATQAGALAGVVRALDLKAPPVTEMCPLDIGSFAVIGFSYHGRPDVGLWYITSGCESVDNGVLGSTEVANPSFYVGFEGSINRLSPPLG